MTKKGTTVVVERADEIFFIVGVGGRGVTGAGGRVPDKEKLNRERSCSDEADNV